MSKNKETEEKNAEDKTDNDVSELSYLKKESSRTSDKKKKYNDYRDEILNMNDNEIKEAIRNYEPIKILDFPKIPYKSIFIILLLLSSSILFVYTGIVKFNEKEKWYNWFSYILLGVLLFIPGSYYGFILINILIGIKGYKYEDIPDLSEQ